MEIAPLFSQCALYT